jgi:hypothetical protein
MSTPNPQRTDPPDYESQVTVQTDYGDTRLLCPRCGDDYLHHGRVEVFARTEDATGVHTTVEAETVRVDRDLTGNPSGRRHGVTIAFSCEGCPDDPDLLLTIAQHKGQTFLAWRRAP